MKTKATPRIPAWLVWLAGLALLASACATTKWVNTWTEPGATRRAPRKQQLGLRQCAPGANPPPYGSLSSRRITA